MIEEVEGLAHLERVILSSTLPQTSGRRKRRGWKMRNETAGKGGVGKCGTRQCSWKVLSMLV